MKNPPLSCYIRAKNEARLIGEVVRAALQVADEVVVIDSGSTDDTVAIAEAAGARVIRHEWLGNGRQKRLGEEACRHDWLLDLDADEIVSPALAAEIRALFEGGAPPAPIYETPMAVVPPFIGAQARFGTVSRAKLYDRRVVRQPADPVWDQFEIPAGVAPGRLGQPILHYAYVDAAHLVGKLNAYSSLQAREKEPKSEIELALRILFGFPFYFARRYFFEGLIFAGVYGFAFTAMTAFGRWLRDVKMYERRLAARGPSGK
jgi:glycosyltransferase involved in cell wall biosynthesis